MMCRQLFLIIGAMFLCGCQPSASGPADGGSDGAVADARLPGPDGSRTDSGSGLSCSGASPSFATAVHPILKGCGGEMCHGGLAQGAWPYTQLVNVKVSRDLCDPSAVIVKPGSLGKSYLLNKLTGLGMCPGTRQMPDPQFPLPPGELQTIADWICQGAKNN